MTPAARLSAAIDVLADIEARRRPAADALKDWGLSHRFAGSGDRAAIAGLVYDALRVRASAAWIMREETPRAILFGALKRMRDMPLETLIALCDGERFAPAPITTAEGAAYAAADLAGAPDHVQGDFPDWLQPQLAATFGDDLVREMQAMATRAPLDLRVNRLKALRQRSWSNSRIFRRRQRRILRMDCGSSPRWTASRQALRASRLFLRAMSKSRMKARSSPRF